MLPSLHFFLFFIYHLFEATQPIVKTQEYQTDRQKQAETQKHTQKHKGGQLTMTPKLNSFVNTDSSQAVWNGLYQCPKEWSAATRRTAACRRSVQLMTI